MKHKSEKIPLDEARNNWINCLKGDDQNAIFHQNTSMVWDTAIFRVIIEGRKARIQQNAEKPQLNVHLHSFIDRNYFQAQSMAIRRLYDPGFELTGDYGVYSLGALIKDISKYRIELNRKAFFDFGKMPYDYMEIQKKESDFIKKQTIGRAFFIPKEFDWETIEATHQVFDRLGGVKADQRSPNDQIEARVFNRLKGQLGECERIATYVDKYVAHSAIPESRINLSETGIKLSQLWEAQRILYEVANFLQYVLFSETQIALAIENAAFFQYWEKPLFEENEKYLVRDALKNYRAETEQWAASGIENTWKWIEEGAGNRDG